MNGNELSDAALYRREPCMRCPLGVAVHDYVGKELANAPSAEQYKCLRKHISAWARATGRVDLNHTPASILAAPLPSGDGLLPETAGAGAGEFDDEGGPK